MKLATDQQIARAISTAAPQPYLMLTPRFKIVWVNDAFAEAAMVSPEAIIGRHIFDVFPDNPDWADADGVSNLSASLETVLRDRRPDAMPMQRYDVTDRAGRFIERYWDPSNFPVFSEGGGEIEFILHHVSDATTTIKQQMILRESSHRYANILAKAQALVMIAKRSAESTDDLAGSILQRLAVLGRTHNNLWASDSIGSDFREIVRTELAPFQTKHNVSVSGPEVQLRASAGQSFAMVVHELAVNAAKHGAFSSSSGRVSIAWEIVRDCDGRAMFRMKWDEENGPAIRGARTRIGNGSRLIQDFLRIEFGAQVAVAFDPSGLRYEVNAPFAKIEAGA